MSSTWHELRTWPEYFRQVWSGEKTFDVRLDDRGFQKGDMLVLREWDRNRGCAPDCEGRHHVKACPSFTGRKVTARIGCVLASTPQGFKGNGFVVLALCEPKNSDVQPDAPRPVEPGMSRGGAGLSGPQVIQPAAKRGVASGGMQIQMTSGYTDDSLRLAIQREREIAAEAMRRERLR